MANVLEEIRDELVYISQQLGVIHEDMPTEKQVEGLAKGNGGGSGPGQGGSKAKGKGGGLMSDAISGVGDRIAKMGANVFGKIGIKLAGVAAIVAGVVVAIGAFVAGTLAATSKMVEAGKHLAKFNAELAGAYAKSTLRDFQRNRQSADNRSSSMSALVEAWDNFKDAIQPFLDLIAVVMAKILTVIVNGFTAILRWVATIIPIQDIIDVLNNIDGNTKKKDPLLPGMRFLKDRATGRDQHLDRNFSFA